MLNEKEKSKLARRHELDGKLLSYIGVVEQIAIILEKISVGSIHPGCKGTHGSSDCDCAEYHADEALGLLE